MVIWRFANLVDLIDSCTYGESIEANEKTVLWHPCSLADVDRANNELEIIP